MRGFVSFLKYNNAVPIAISFALLGAASTYAAANPEAIYTETAKVISIDNTYIAYKDFDDYSPTVRVLSVSEDEDHYYVTYELSTIALKDYVWQDVVEERVMEVAKMSLGEFRDLGLFVTKQLRELIASELARLKETQEFEQKQISQKQVAIAYGGLVGGFLDAKTETIDGYEPVVVPPESEPELETFARPDPKAQKPAVPVTPAPVAQLPIVPPAEEPGEPKVGQEPTATSTATTTPSSPTTPTNKPPKLTILGDNPARVALGGSYTDLGAVVEDDHDADATVNLFLDDVPVQKIIIDTSAVRTYVITYESTDSDGAIGQKKRTVEVYDPNAGSSGGGSGGGTGGGTTAPTSTPPTKPTSTPPTTKPPIGSGSSTPPAPEPTPTPTPTPTPEPEPTPEPAPEPEPTPEPAQSSNSGTQTNTSAETQGSGASGAATASGSGSAAGAGGESAQ